MRQNKVLCFFAGILVIGLSLLVAACDRSSNVDNTNAGKELSVKEQESSKSGLVINWPDNMEPAYVKMELKKVSDHTYFVEGPPGMATENEGFMSNAGVVVTKDGVVVFDALGTPSLSFMLYNQIRTVTDKPVVKVIVSHYHADHIYGLQVFKKMGAEIVAPQGARDYLLSDAAQARLKERRESLFPWVNEDTYLVDPDVYIKEDTRFTLGGINFEIVLLGSTHSQGDLMLHVTPDEVLFSGDLIFEGRIPLVAGSNPEVWLERLSMLNTDSIKYVIPGHGSMSRNPKQALQFTRDYLAFLHDGMAGAVENLMTFEEAFSSLDWSAYENLPASQANRLNAYYVFLRQEALSMQR